MVNSITTAIHLVVAYFFIIYLELGIYGSFISSGITYLLNLAIVTFNCYRNPALKESFFFPNKECFEDMGAYLKIGFQLAIQIALGFWVMEIEVLLSSFIDIASNAGMVILLNT